MKRIKTKKVYWILLGAIYLLLFYAFMYSDILITTSHGINLWDILFDGNVFDYYKFCTSDVSNAAYEIYNIPGYDFLIYIVFALWNLPIWIARRFFAVNIWESALAMMWAKSLILLFTILVAYSMIKICRTLLFEEKRIRQVLFLFLTSSLLGSCVFIMAQYDVIYLFFMLEALNCYLKKQMKRFTFYMAIALPFKPLSLFLFAPLLLYKEKNVFNICLHTMGVLLPLMIFKIVFASGVNEVNMSNVLIMFRNKIEIANIEIPIFLLAVFILYFLCYSLKTPQDDKEFQIGSLRIAFIAYAIFFVLCGGNPYWLILMVPFQYLLMVANESTAFLSSIIETITSICLVGCQIWQTCWCFDARLLRSTYMVKIYGERSDSTNNILDIIHNIAPSLYDLANERAAGILYGIFVAGIFAFIWVNYGKRKDNALEAREIPDYLFAVRLFLFIAECFVPIIAFIF